MLQALAQLKTKVRDLPGAARSRARASWANSFHGFLKKHFIKSAAEKVRKAQGATATPKAAAFDFLKGLDHQFQARRRLFCSDWAVAKMYGVLLPPHFPPRIRPSHPHRHPTPRRPTIPPPHHHAMC